MKRTVVLCCLIFIYTLPVKAQAYAVHNQKQINYIDSKGLRQGVWDFYDDAADIRVSTRIKDDVAGDTIYYYKNGELRFTYVKSKTDTVRYFINDGGVVCSNYFTLKDIFYCNHDSVAKKRIDSYIFHDIFPFYYGGNDSMYGYIRHCAEKAPKGQTGHIKVSFMLDNAGRPTQVEIKSSDNPKLNEFCLKVIKEMPRWQAGYQGGSVVKVPMVLPLNFN